MTYLLYAFAVIQIAVFGFIFFKYYQYNVPHWFRIRFGKEFAEQTNRWANLTELEFVHAVAATTPHTYLIVDGVKQMAGGYLTVVLQHKGVIFGNIGLDCTPYGMHVVQMQGVKGVCLSKLGISNTDRFFLECVESIARKLGFQKVRILEASSHQYFEKDPSWGSFEKREALKVRMIRRYNLVPKKMGYRACWFSPWNEKNLTPRKVKDT